MIEINAKDLLEYVSIRWHRKSSLIIILCLIIIFSLYFFSDINFEKLSISFFIFISILATITVTLWLQYRKISKIPKGTIGTIGILIGIHCETEPDSVKISSDFIDLIKSNFESKNRKYPFKIVKLKHHIIERISNPEYIQTLFLKSNSKLILTGSTKTRLIGGISTRILNLCSWVYHIPIPTEISKHLSSEFSKIYPWEIEIPMEDEYVGLKVQSEDFNYIAKFILGTASLITGDNEFSLILFEEIKQWIEKDKSWSKFKVNLNRYLIPRLIDTNTNLANFYYQKWKTEPNLDLLEKMNFHLQKVLALDTNDYQAILLKAIYIFVKNRDIEKALSLLKKCRRIQNNTWKYSVAFLYAYKNDLDRSYSYYISATKTPGNNFPVIDSETFIMWMIELEPNNPSLYFSIGLINYYAKEDFILAKEYFTKFLTISNNVKFKKIINNLILKKNS